MTLTVHKDMVAPVELKDVLTGDGFDYDTGSLSVEGNGINANFSSTVSSTSTTIQVRPASGNTVPAGTYTIHYRVKSLEDVSDPSTTLPEKVGNKISVGDDDTCSSETWTKTTPGSINKQGQLVTGSSETYIDYTVYLNADGIIKNLKNPALFSDTLPESLELDSDVTVEQYNVSGKLVATNKATVEGQTITYTTPTGQYYYIIIYRAKVVDDKIPLGGMDIKNTATSTGSIDGESEDTTRVPNHALYKTFESQELQQNESGEWVDVIRWQSRLMVKGNLKGYVYEDYGELMDDANKKHFAPLSMSEAQRNAIVITDANGDVVDSSLYTVEPSDRKGWNSDINVGLFRIEFTGDVTGPVTIEYETTANIWNLVEFGYYTFYNNGDLILGNDNDSSRAETDKIQYRKDSTNIIHKYGKNYDGKGSSKDVSLDAGENTLQWTIQLNEGNSLYEDLTVTDPMPEGLTLDPTTLKIKAGDANITSDTSLVVWSYENDVLTVQVKASAYSGTNSDGTTYSNAVLITYKTILPDSFLKGSEVSRTYVNTATVKVTGGEVSSTYTQEVTREVLNKFGSYDEDNQLLTYTIVINPDAATLNGGGDLTVTDHLGFNDDEYYTLLENITLRSLRLFTVYKTTNDNGDVICRPGRYVRDLDLAESGTALYTYTWNQSTGTFVTWLPDGTACILLAEYSVDDSNVSKDVHVKNEVEISAQSKWETKDDHTQIKKHTGGSTYTGDKLILTKHDREQYNKKLSGAVFSLQRYEQRYDPESQNWTEITILTTEGNQGNVSTDQIGRNTLYRLVETQAPSGYILDTTPSYFMITTTSQETAARAALPETISGDEYYSKDSVVVYTVLDRPVNANDVDDTRYYALVEIDCYNTKEGIEVILPETGSVGAQPFAAAGAGLMMVSASLMALRRRRR